MAGRGRGQSAGNAGERTATHTADSTGLPFDFEPLVGHMNRTLKRDLERLAHRCGLSVGRFCVEVLEAYVAGKRMEQIAQKEPR